MATNTWNRIWIEPFKQDDRHLKLGDETYPATMRWWTHLWAERSDGKLICLMVYVEKDEFTPKHVGFELQKAFATLDTVWKDKEDVSGD